MKKAKIIMIPPPETMSTNDGLNWLGERYNPNDPPLSRRGRDCMETLTLDLIFDRTRNKDTPPNIIIHAPQNRCADSASRIIECVGQQWVAGYVPVVTINTLAIPEDELACIADERAREMYEEEPGMWWMFWFLTSQKLVNGVLGTFDRRERRSRMPTAWVFPDESIIAAAIWRSQHGATSPPRHTLQVLAGEAYPYTSFELTKSGDWTHLPRTPL